ncbi:MAG TPA: MYXO-CTERM sorting domain-containing protein [Kofleriaceae bacterium]|nr:MYXO-CTERM sorting domain-containing protein [Kofleriaceae bacterium]
MKLIFALAAVIVALPARANADVPAVSPYLYLNRCSGGCMVKGGFDDARALTSSLPCNGTTTCGGGSCQCNGVGGGEFLIDEFEDTAGNVGAAADAEWKAILKCVQEVYSPYNITVSDVPPPGGLSHSMAIVAGYPHNIGYRDTDIGGIAPGTLGCGPQDNVVSFSFANTYAGPADHRILTLCYVASQESAHAFGVPDHTFNFIDGQSGCIDPMSYRGDCGGQRFFRNKLANCGEGGPRPCKCPNQNSHKRLLSTFGPGTPITRPPAVRIDSPTMGTVTNGQVVFATASAQRGIFRVELWLNGYKWASVPGAKWGANGQPESQYALTFPAMVPDGVIDIVVKAFDDIEAKAETSVITVTKGQPCMSADSCLKGQKCDAGKCFWEEPRGQVGDACDYPQFCISSDCLNTDQGQYCSQDCVVGVSDSCPAGFSCEGAAGATGKCVKEDVGGGCCSVGDDGKTAALFTLIVGGLLGRRRRVKR